MKKMIDNEKAMKLLKVADKVDFESDEMTIEGTLDVGGKLTAKGGITVGDGTYLTVPSASGVFVTDESNTLDQMLDAKQDKLVSGTNIKTINGNSVLGSGNITIEGGGSALAFPYFVKFTVTASNDDFIFNYYTTDVTKIQDILQEFVQTIIDNIDDVVKNPSDWGYESTSDLAVKLDEYAATYDNYNDSKAFLDWLVPLMNSTAQANAQAGGLSALIIGTDCFGYARWTKCFAVQDNFICHSEYGRSHYDTHFAIIEAEDSSQNVCVGLASANSDGTISIDKVCTTQEFIDGKVSFTLQISPW